MKHKVKIYDIEHDTTKWREFDSYYAAKKYANDMKEFLLNRLDPAPVFIDIMPVE